MSDLFTLSDELNTLINQNVSRVKETYNNVDYEEYIVIPKLNNMIMLRFTNNDIKSLTLEELSKREQKIRELVSPNFLANFLGKDYKIFGLNINSLEKTLLNANSSLKTLGVGYYPMYYEQIENDLSKISYIFGEKLDFWELQVHEGIIDVLFFTDDLDIKEINNLTFSPVKYNDSYNGINKALLHAIKEETSLVEVLLRYQQL